MGAYTRRDQGFDYEGWRWEYMNRYRLVDTCGFFLAFMFIFMRIRD